MTDWRFFHGNGEPKKNLKEELKKLTPPPWRRFGKEEDIPNDGRWERVLELLQEKEKDKRRGKNFRISSNATEVINAVNAAIYLRRPLLITGKPGSGKTSLAYAIAHELNLGPVLSWSITTRTTLQDGLYRYDAIARLQDANLAKLRQDLNPKEEGKEKYKEPDIGNYITLGALGTAFLPAKLPRVLLIDEIDKSDINLPNDLLNIFEEGEFQIPELVRSSKSQSVDNSQDQNSQHQEDSFQVNTQDRRIPAVIKEGWVRCYAFPIIVMTSNGEKDFPSAFKRRCIRITMPDPQLEELQAIVGVHFADKKNDLENPESKINDLIKQFLSNDPTAERATDQLLNTIHILTGDLRPQGNDEESIRKILFRDLKE